MISQPRPHRRKPASAGDDPTGSPRFGSMRTLATVAAAAIAFGVRATAFANDDAPASTPPFQPSDQSTTPPRPASSGVFVVPNAGQWTDDSVRYALRAPAWNIAFRDSEIACLLMARAAEGGEGLSLNPARPDLIGERRVAALSITFEGADSVVPIATDPTLTRINYFVGGEGRTSAANLTGYRAVVYEELYPGIDLHVRTTDTSGSIKYEFHLDPGVDPGQIRIVYDGLAEPLRLTQEGELEIPTPAGTLRDGTPIAWQPTSTTVASSGEQQAVGVAHRLLADNTSGFTITGELDPTRPLVIDPELMWMVYLGGSERDYAGDIALDPLSDELLVVGGTESDDFDRRTNTYHTGTWSLSDDAFVCRIAPSGFIRWMTYLGGTQQDEALAVIVDNEGHVFVTGSTSSTDFEGRNNRYHGGDSDAFLSKVDASGRLEWTTYLGGGRGGDDIGEDVAIDASNGKIAVAGSTGSLDFWGAKNAPYGGRTDGFLCQVTPEGGLDGMLYIGGNESDICTHVMFDSAGQVVLAGSTESLDWQGMLNIFHGHQFNDAFICRLAPDNTIEWMRFLGGSDFEWPQGAVVDPGGDIYVSGETRSTDFEGRVNSFHTSIYYGYKDGFVCRVGPDGSLKWMSYIGGRGTENCSGIVPAPDGGVLGVGLTTSDDFDARINEIRGGGQDAFVCEVDRAGTVLWSRYLGGHNGDWGEGVVRDREGRVYVAGYTTSSDWEGRINRKHDGELQADAFVVRLDEDPPLCLNIELASCPGPAVLRLCCAKPGDELVIVQGTRPGAREIQPWCPGTYINFARPTVVGRGVADADGCLELRVDIPAALCGVLRLQGVNLTTCDRSVVRFVN